MWALLGFPTGVLPITRVKSEEQIFADTFNDAWTLALHEDAKGSVNMPIGLQITGKAFDDEKVLGVMKVL